MSENLLREIDYFEKSLFIQAFERLDNCLTLDIDGADEIICEAEDTEDEPQVIMKVALFKLAECRVQLTTVEDFSEIIGGEAAFRRWAVDVEPKPLVIDGIKLAMHNYYGIIDDRGDMEAEATSDTTSQSTDDPMPINCPSDYEVEWREFWKSKPTEEQKKAHFDGQAEEMYSNRSNTMLDWRFSLHRFNTVMPLLARLGPDFLLK
jgi:hypothetical protein